jgi:hypothetical protein
MRCVHASTVPRKNVTERKRSADLAHDQVSS